jgi:hypothetical protein
MSRNAYGKIREQRGAVSIELIGAIPVVLLGLLVAAQFVAAGHAFWSAGISARAGARAVLTGKQPRGAAERSLPSGLREGLRISADDGVRVGVRIPSILPGMPEAYVYGSSSLGDG